MDRVRRALLSGLLVASLAPSGAAFAQTPPGDPPPARGQRPAGRQALPPVTPNMNQQQLQAWLDTYAVVQAERELLLTAEQYPNFVARLRRLQDIRRRRMADRRRIMNELSGLMQSNAASRDESITARLRALDEGVDGLALDLRKAYQDLDAVLTPWQRGRFRLFEDQLERRKVELLAKIRGGG